MEGEAGALLVLAELLGVGAGTVSSVVLGSAIEAEEVLEVACSLIGGDDSLAAVFSAGFDSAGLF